MIGRNSGRSFGSLVVLVALGFAAPALGAKKISKNPVCPLPGQTGTCTQLTPTTPLLPATQPKYFNELPQPVFYTPDQSDGVFDYYEVFSKPADVGLAAPKFPFDLANTSAAVLQPDTFSPTLFPSVQKVWLGLCNVTPAAGQVCPPANRLYTEVWGYGQAQTAAGPVPALGGPVSTYPAMSFRATRGRPVKVKWMNQLPNQHIFCKEPLNSDIPCGIDRTLMGTRATPAPYAVTAFGGNQQPDNAMVVHLHGGEIPPDSDGFAELWFGNTATATAYSAALPGALPDATQNIDPHWAGILGGIQPGSAPGATWNGNSTITGDPTATVLGSLIRPTGSSMIYNYPMVQDAATIWYHDHALGKTRVNVAAGPAGYFYVQDPAIDPALFGALPDQPGYAFGDCSNGGILLGACRDVPIVLQDRAFNADGSINFPNLLGQAALKGANPLTPGPNPTIHPQWVPEYFGDMAVVNGITWPKLTVGPGAYRFRFLDGSNARCYVLSLTAPTAAGAPAGAPIKPFTIIAGDQGYLPNPVTAQTLTICPGERYEAVVDFSGLANGTRVDLYNTAGAPFPNGITPQMPLSPDLYLATMMQFVVDTTVAAPTWTVPATWNATLGAGAANTTTGRIAALTTAGAPFTNPGGVQVPINPQAPPLNRRHFVLNEVLDRSTRAPLMVQIDGLPFEAPVTETPKRGTTEIWDIANTTVDAHPMHLHLVQFKVIGRWNLDIAAFTRAALTGFPPVVNKAIDPAAYVIGTMLAPEPGEEGLKDTARSYPGQLLRVVAHWDGAWADKDPVVPGVPVNGLNAPVCEAPLATDLATAAGPCRCVQTQVCQAPTGTMATMPADPTCACVPDLVADPTGATCAGAPGAEQAWMVPACGATIYKPYFQPVTAGPYVWHCHIVDHEDNEMMRPVLVLP